MRPRTDLIVVAFLVVLLCSSPFCFGNDDVLLTSKHSHHRHHHHHHHHKRHHHHARKHSPRPAHHKDDHQPVFNVEEFGAKSDEKTDNFPAFKKAWDKACASPTHSRVLVPEGKTYYVKHINFTGPCNSSISIEIQGTIKSFPQMYDTPRRLWIKFEDVKNIDVFGNGTIDGNGQVWWENSCKLKKTEPCQSQNAPTALTFSNCSNLRLRDLKVVNAQQMHVNFQDCNGVIASGLSVVAPEKSPNTDGIHVTRTTNLRILDSVIETGDDCISIVNGSRNVDVKKIVCGPGHGISIGSLGEDNTANYVSDIYVKGVMLTGTTNGLRIKTWQGGSGHARNIKFEDIVMRDVLNPIIINQNYCDKNKKCEKQKSAVQVENVIYKNIRGTSASNLAVAFNCSESLPCRNIVMQNVDLRPQTQPHDDSKNIEAFCNNLSEQSVSLNSYPSCPMHN